MTTPLEAIKASLPPATDPLTFLTILEYNLKPDLLPDLHQILQDPQLTANIGWDLISLLTPLLPASTACLQEVARLGNPRECVLKILESLRQLDFADENAIEDDDDEEEDEVVKKEEKADNIEEAKKTSNEESKKEKSEDIALEEKVSKLDIGGEAAAKPQEPVATSDTPGEGESVDKAGEKETTGTEGETSRETDAKEAETTRETDSKLDTENTTGQGAEATDKHEAKTIIKKQEPTETETNTKPDAEITKTDPQPEEDAPVLALGTFTLLLSLLSTIHPRIKSSKPSRFLSSTLQAILATYTSATQSLSQDHIDILTLEIIRFVKSVSGHKRPQLPPRKSTHDAPHLHEEAAPDPEAQDETPSPTELALTTRLLQSFTTHILEDYLLCLDEDALSWSARYQEKTHPEKVVPRRRTACSRYTDDAIFQARDSTVGQLVALAQDLELDNAALAHTLLSPEVEPPELDGPPTDPSDIPLSSSGALFLLTSRLTSPTLFSSSSSTKPSHDAAFNLPIFPSHATLTKTFLGTNGPSAIGTEPEPVIDAVLALGLFAFTTRQLGEIASIDPEAFASYLQSLSLLSANHPSPTIRYASHSLTSSVLHAHPSDTVRLSFIRDTLQYCPYENLKASAVEWLKTETLAAFLPYSGSASPDPSITATTKPVSASLPLAASESTTQSLTTSASDSVFATPLPLSKLTPYLFPPLTNLLPAPIPIIEAWTHVKTSLPFYLATLNFYYLLLSAERLRVGLEVDRLKTGTYLRVLRGAAGRFEESLRAGGEGSLRDEEGGGEGEGVVQRELADLGLLGLALGRVEIAREMGKGAGVKGGEKREIEGEVKGGEKGGEKEEKKTPADGGASGLI